MLEINLNDLALSPMNQNIHNKIKNACTIQDSLTIMDAAILCECSTSKISKFVKKVGFANYKQYIDFIYGRVPTTAHPLNEFDRIKLFLDTYDSTITLSIIDKISKHKKIALLGYGPSKYCARYLKFKLQLCIDHSIYIIEDELSATSIIDEDTLLMIFSTTGSYKSFYTFQQIAKKKHASLLLIVEEFAPSVTPTYGDIIFLTNTKQTVSNIPYEKSRILFFILIEEIIAQLLKL